jgi:hypothetical protein
MPRNALPNPFLSAFLQEATDEDSVIIGFHLCNILSDHIGVMGVALKRFPPSSSVSNIFMTQVDAEIDGFKIY